MKLKGLNFVKKENQELFETALDYAYFDVFRAVSVSVKERTEKALKKDGLTDNEKKALQDKLAKAEADIANADEIMAKIQSKYSHAMNLFTGVADENGKSNDKETVANVLRILACSGQKADWMRYAVRTTLESTDADELYNALEICHSFDKKEVNEDGVRKNTEVRREAYKKANKYIKSFLKLHLSIPVENPVTDRMVVNFTADELCLLHDLYVCGVGNKFNDDENGISFVEREVRKLGNKSKKNGVVLNKLYNTIGTIAVAHYFDK